MNPRGISPLIATVLIIGFTVALAAVIITWGSMFIQTTVESSEKEAVKYTGSVKVDIKVRSTNGTERTVTVENKGIIPIEALVVRNGPGTKRIDLVLTPQGILKPFEIKKYDISKVGVSLEDPIEVIPGLDFDKDGDIEFFEAKVKQIPQARDPYYRVFVTSQTYDGNLSGLEGADNKCQTLANNQGLGGMWKAWLSTGGISASSRLYHSLNGPYKLLNGNIVAYNWSDLTSINEDNTNYIRSHIKIDEKDIEVTSPYKAFTGTDVIGNPIPGVGEGWCISWTNIGGINNYQAGRVGLTGRMNSDWTTTSDSEDCGFFWRLYCFEQPWS